MKKLISRFRKLPFIERFLSERNLPFTVFVSTVLVVVSCQLAETKDQGQVSDTLDQNVESVRPPLAPEAAESPQISADDLRLIANADTKPEFVARLFVPDCTPGNTREKELRFKISLHSDFGDHDADLTLVNAGDKEAVRAQIEQFRMNFTTSMPVKAGLLQAACDAKAKDAAATTLTLTPPQLLQLRDWMLLIAPDCKKMEPVAGGFDCQLEQISPLKAKDQLTAIQTDMIRRWSRQPYLLARRLAIGISLAQALENDKSEHALDTVCHIVKSSLPIELPAALSSKRWQAVTCNKDNQNRRRTAAFGLAKTVTEINFMKQLFEATSRLGFLTIRVPAKALPNKDLLVSLAPEDDVADNLAKETAKLWGEGTDTTGELPHVCWHPMFGEAKSLLKLARQLTMAGEAARVACAQLPVKSDEVMSPTERYIAESITSETEFVITNGRSKTLRLPTGSYKYTLRSLPANPDEWDDASQVNATAEGQIVWDAKRPRPVIATW